MVKSLIVEELQEILDEYLEVEFTFIHTDALSAEMAVMPRDRQDFILQWTKSAAAVNTELAFQFARRAGDALNRTDLEMVADWCVHAMDQYDSIGLHPAMEVIRNLEDYLEQGYLRKVGSLYENATPILLPFVHGLEGRKFRVQLADYAWTDGEVLYLPEIVARLDTEEENFQLFKAIVVHLWGQVRFGTLNINLPELLADFEDVEKAQSMFHRLETIRLDARIKTELPGLYRQMMALATKLDDQDHPDGWQPTVVDLQRAEATVEDTVEWLKKLYHGDLPQCPCYQSGLNPEAAWLAREARLLKDKARLREILKVIADDMEAAGEQGKRPESFELKEKEDAAEHEILQWEIAIDDMPLIVPEEVQQQLTSILLDLSEIPPEYLTPAGEGEYDPSLFKEDEQDPNDVWSGTYHEEGAYLYDEWDSARQAYKKNWCVLRELGIEPASTEFYTQTLNKYQGHLRSLRKTFEVLRGENRLLKRQRDGEEIDFDALVETWADVQAGHEMSEHVFARMHKEDRNIAVLFMVDMSGSTRGWINDAERESLILLAESLETLGDRYAIYGFSGWSRKRCEVFKVKDFDEYWSEDVIGKVCAIEAKDYTRMGAPIRHFTEILSQVEARTKLLITLSDGKPDDYDLEYRGDYGIDDTRQALYEARRNGVHAYCITIDKEGPEYLPHMYGAASYTVLDDVAQLPMKISDIYRKITT